MIRTVLGTGGIGSGVLYALEGNADLGRNESRLASKLPDRDFCKQHIILHYVATFLTAWDRASRVFPIGAVGRDEVGDGLKKEMHRAGMNVKYVQSLRGTPTMFSVCFLYPDKSGGNLTEKNSASERVRPSHIRSAAKELKRARGRGMVLAAPEVPLETRTALLRMGRKNGALTMASFVAEDAKEIRRRKLLKDVDVVAVNLDEAAAIADVKPSSSPRRIAEACIGPLKDKCPGLKWSITLGNKGAYAYSAGTLERQPALRVKVVNTAGGGDASLAGLMIGCARDLPFLGRNGPTCAKLARLISAMSVTSADTIHFGITPKSLRAFAAKHGQTEMARFLNAGT